MKKRVHRLIKCYVLILVAGLLYALLFSEFGIKIPCIFNAVTGLLCPACGISRMCISILKGNFYEAFYYNKLIFLLIPVFIFWFIKWSTDYVKKGRIVHGKIEKLVIILVIVSLMVFGILRNFI